jgi:S1-C subfamily serine protease
VVGDEAMKEYSTRSWGKLILLFVACIFISNCAGPVALQNIKRGNWAAAQQFIKETARTNKDAQGLLGMTQLLGLGTQKNYKVALRNLEASAAAGEANGDFGLAIAYEYGLGVERDPGRAQRILRSTPINKNHCGSTNLNDANSGVSLSMFGVAMCNRYGIAPQLKNPTEAIRWFELAAQAGIPLGFLSISEMYQQGIGVPKDALKAERYLKRASAGGVDTSFSNTTQNSSVKIAKRSPVNSSSPKPSPPSKTGTSGSGFFVSKLGHVITNEHIVRECGNVTVGDNAKKQVTVTIVEKDKRNDLALLRISSTKMASADTKSLISKLGITVVPLASDGLLRSEDVELGEDVLVSGYPYGDIFSNTIKVTKGIVSANRGFGDDTGQFQMDAAVQAGSSGGPIYDENGNIVGVVVAQLNKLKVAKAIGSFPENVNFGIKASTVRQFLTASGLPTKWSKRPKRMSTKQLAKIAKNQTVMVVCNP